MDRVLIVEDDAGFAKAVARMIAGLKVETKVARSLRAALQAVGTDLPDAVLLDIHLPDGSGAAVLEALADPLRGVPIILMTANPSVDTAVVALRHGAFDYLVKPFTEEEINLTLNRALEVSRLRRELRRLRERPPEGSCGIVGRTPAIEAVRARARAIASTTASVLVTGETGVGKERVARAVHDLSGRKGPFVAVNCGAIPETLFEAEIFGARKGAYTGATADRAGLVGEAEGGTLFLDEIGEIPLSSQPKFLRLLQEHTYRWVGETRERKANIRVVAATNRDLRSEIAEKRFREDLFWRLAVVEIRVPPLRERVDDIAPLAAYILSSLAARHGREIPTVTPEALARLEGYAWPGNVRELENVLERSMLFRLEGSIGEADLDLQRAVRAGAPETLDAVLERQQSAAEREYLVHLLRLNAGGVDASARMAGRNRTAFYRLLKKHNLDPDAYRAPGGRSAP